ncbi:ATP-binding cassette domain-containing protein, partial [Marinobacter sp.]|uniref:ATP-binding cassette domain-containing protein n=1 Tax=Marinobacter sp. TaxID=50741 RepID=UPI0035C67598
MIHIRGLAKQSGSHAVLRGIDLDVPAGQFLVVLGPSGAGKSTLLRCLNGLVQPSAGEIRVAGFDATDTGARQVRQLRRQVAMIF